MDRFCASTVGVALASGVEEAGALQAARAVPKDAAARVIARGRFQFMFDSSKIGFNLNLSRDICIIPEGKIKRYHPTVKVCKIKVRHCKELEK